MATVFTLAGAFGTPYQIPPMLGGEVTDGNVVVPLWYPNFTIFESQVDTGAAMLDQQLRDTPGEIICMGHSLGAVVCCNWLENYGPQASSYAPPEYVSFVLLGNSMRKYGGLCYALNYYPNSKCPDDTPYRVTDFSRQYDGWADVPDTIGNIVADLNVFAGQSNVHPTYNFVRLEDPLNVSHQEGNINYVWSPTAVVPLLGTYAFPGVQPWDEELRRQIEPAYDRPVDIPFPAGETSG